MRRIIIIGGGFAGIAAAHRLKQRLHGMKKIEITLISKRTHFFSSPHLDKVAVGKKRLSQIKTNLSELISAPIQTTISAVSQILPLEKEVHTDSAGVFPYDYLIIATGSRLDWRGLQPHYPHVLGCNTARDFVNVWEHLNSSIENAERDLKNGVQTLDVLQSRLRFVVIGAGPTGTTLVSRVSEFLRDHSSIKRNPDLLEMSRVVLVDANDRILNEFPELSKHARAELEELGVELMLKRVVKAFTKTGVIFENSEELETENLLWCAGVKRHNFLDDKEGRIVDHSLRHHNFREIYIAGDAVDNSPETMNAKCAMEQGQLAANNIIADLSGRKSERWSRKTWPVIIEIGSKTIARNEKGDVLVGRSAQIFAKTSQTRLVNPWTGNLFNSQNGGTVFKYLLENMVKKTTEKIFANED